MRMRSVLPSWIAALAGVLRNITLRLQAPVRLHRVHHDIPSAIIRRENKFSRIVYGDMARDAGRRLLVELCQIPRLPVNGEGGQSSTFLAIELRGFIDGIQKLPARIDRQERWAGNALDDRREF